MNSKNIVPIEKDKILCTCMKCLKEGKKEDMHIIHIPEMGYGSGFDGFDTLVILCDDCYKESTKDIPHLWDMEEKTRIVVYKENDHLTDEEREANKTSTKTYAEDYLVPIDMQNDVIYTEDCENHFDEYKYEDEMFAYIRSLPLQSQELVYNRLDRGLFSRGGHDPQDWIDYYLNELSPEKCKKNYWVYRGENK